MKKNFCSGCGYNFGNETMFFDHRTGAYNLTNKKGDAVATPIGHSRRRCKTDSELTALGWELVTVDVDVTVGGVAQKQPMQTWVLPGQIEARQERMKKVVQSRLKHTL